MKYRWGIINSYIYSCKECKRIYKSINDNKKNMLDNIGCAVISLLISCGISMYLLDNYVYTILFFVLFSSVLVQLKFIISSRMPNNLLEIDMNGVPIEEKGEYYVKLDSITKKVKTIQRNKPFKIETESEIGIFKLYDWKVLGDELIITVRRYSISPKLQVGQKISLLNINSDNIIGVGEIYDYND